MVFYGLVYFVFNGIFDEIGFFGDLAQGFNLRGFNFFSSERFWAWSTWGVEWIAHVRSYGVHMLLMGHVGVSRELSLGKILPKKALNIWHLRYCNAMATFDFSRFFFGEDLSHLGLGNLYFWSFWTPKGLVKIQRLHCFYTKLINLPKNLF